MGEISENCRDIAVVLVAAVLDRVMMVKRAVKILSGGIAIAILTLGIGWLSRNAILETVLEGALQDTLRVGTDIEGLNLQPDVLTIQTITLHNPQGFSTPYLIQVQNLELDFQLFTLLQNPVDLEKLSINGLDLKVEQQIPDNNVAKVVEILRAKESSAGTQAKVVNIGRLNVRNIQASVTVRAMGNLGLEKDLEIGDIELTEVTSENAEGKISVAIATAVTTALLAEVSQNGLPL